MTVSSSNTNNYVPTRNKITPNRKKTVAKITINEIKQNWKYLMALIFQFQRLIIWVIVTVTAVIQDIS